MSELSVEDVVVISGGMYSEVVISSHRIGHGSYEFEELDAVSSVLRATAHHYIYATGRNIPAGGVQATRSS